MANLDRCLNVWDLRAAAKRRLPKGVFEFVDRATEDHIAVANNRSAFERHQAAPSRAGRCVRPQRRHHAVRQARQPADGDRAHRCRRPVLARGRTGTRQGRGEGEDPADPVHRVDDRRWRRSPQVGGRLWFQLYVWKRRELSHQLIERANRNGFEALIVTVDSPVSRQPRIQHA